MTAQANVRSRRLPPPGYAIRPLRDGDVAVLCALEWRAGQAFAGVGYPELAAYPPRGPDAFAAQFAETDIFVAVDGRDVPAGFAATLEIDGWLWLAELSVDPDHGRKGIGSALLDAVATDASARGLAGVALSTFRDVPFNAPFYRSNGYAEPEAPPPVFVERLEAEIPPGVKHESRLLMVRRID